MRFQAATGLVIPGNKILDVGGGKGDFFLFSGLSGVVADLFPSRSLFGEVATASPFVPFDGLSLPFESKSFDVIVCLDTLEHVPKDRRPALVREMQRVARDRIVLTFPEKQFYLPLLISIANLYSKIGAGSIMQRSLQEHSLHGLPSADEVLSSVDQTQWYASQSSFFGRLSTLIWVIQLLMPVLGTSFANRFFSYITSNVPSHSSSERLILLQHRRNVS